MAYEFEEVRLSQEIFYYLLEYHELTEEGESRLYRAYVEDEQVMGLVKGQAEAAKCNVEKYGNVIYLIPKEENSFLGFSKNQLKGILVKSSGTDKDYYLSQFVILTLLVEFYDGQGASSKSRDYLKTGELSNSITKRLKEGCENEAGSPVPDGASAKGGLAFSNMAEAYEALRSEENGSRARTTKEGFLYNILNFLQKQGLIVFIEEDEMIKPTKKLDNFMDWNLLNQYNYHRVLRAMGIEDREDA